MLLSPQLLFTPPHPLGLQTNLSAFWSLEEASGNAADDTGNGNTLSDTAGTTGVAGKVGNGRQFVKASSQYLSRASTSKLQTGGIDYSFSLWVKLASKAAIDIVLLNKGLSSAGESEYQVRYDQSADRFRLDSYNGSGASLLGTAVANNLGSPSTGVWYHIACWRSVANSQVGIVVNNGTANTGSTSGSGSSNTRQFTMGVNWDNTTSFLDGIMDQVGVWQNRVLSLGDIANLYNGGNGLSYAAMQ